MGAGGQLDTLVGCRGPSIQELLLGWAWPWWAGGGAATMALLPGCVCFHRSLWHRWACGCCPVRPGVSECESWGLGFLAVFALSNREGR